MSALPPIPTGNTNLVIEVVEENRVAVRRYEDGQLLVVMDPDNALEICDAIAQRALAIKGGVLPLGGEALKVASGEKARKVLVPRVVKILNTTQSKAAQWRAEQIVDSCLSEILS
jgi:hypothetical protein